MAFTSNRNLQTDNHLFLKDQQHAARVFADDQFRLAPKQKFLFHVAFGINPSTVYNQNLIQRYGKEINMLVKAVDLPHFSIKVDMVNQYNKKKQIQYIQEYQEIGIKFHDDNMGLINALWQNYYNYYYADPTSATVPGAYSRNATQNSNYIPTAYGLDNGSTIPFFNYIKIYQMARHEYVQYTLANPIITSWNHNRLDYSQGNQTHDFDMRLKYEAVAYNVGAVDPSKDPAGGVEGFADTHYDHISSSLKGVNPDPTVNSPSFVQALDIKAAAPTFIDQVVTQINTYQNTQQPINSNGTSGVINANPNNSNAGGLSGYQFPSSQGNNSTTTTKRPK
jgi:hypothetical protein